MGKLWQILGNVSLYAFLLWLLYGSVKDKDPWFAAVVAFVLVLGVVITLVPGLHAKGVSPGQYPYDD